MKISIWPGVSATTCRGCGSRCFSQRLITWVDGPGSGRSQQDRNHTTRTITKKTIGQSQSPVPSVALLGSSTSSQIGCRGSL